MIKQVISGGQTGIDRLGLKVAKKLGFKTGGTAPLGFRTEDGPDLSLRDEYGLIESWSSDYSPRTLQNVLDSDGTVLFGDPSSPGSIKTIKCCQSNGKKLIINPTVSLFKMFLHSNNIGIINIAGNRGSKLKVKDIEKYEYILVTTLEAFI